MDFFSFGSLGITQNISFDWKDINDKIKVYSYLTNKRPSVNGTDLVLSPVPNYPNCKIFDLHQHFSKRDIPSPRQVFFRLKKVANFGINIYLLDKDFATRRSLKSELLAYSGPTLTNPDLGNISKTERFILKITQTKDAEEDESNGCKDYPNQRFKTFGECDGHFIHELVREEGLMPFWATDNLEEVTKRTLYDYNENGTYVDLLDGTLESDCPTPCLQTKVNNRITRSL